MGLDVRVTCHETAVRRAAERTEGDRPTAALVLDFEARAATLTLHPLERGVAEACFRSRAWCFGLPLGVVGEALGRYVRSPEFADLFRQCCRDYRRDIRHDCVIGRPGSAAMAALGEIRSALGAIPGTMHSPRVRALAGPSRAPRPQSSAAGGP